MPAVPVESAKPGGPTTLIGRPSSTREEWEAARAADAADLNRLLEEGGEVEVYVAPLWSNGDAARCIQELRGFDDAQVYAEVASGGGIEEALADIAEAEWLGAAGRGDDLPAAASLIHIAASLEIPIYLSETPHGLKALTLALSEDLTPREIETVLRGEWKSEPSVDALDHARELLTT